MDLNPPFGQLALIDLLKKMPTRENTQPLNMIYGEKILFEDHTANYALDEFVERVEQLKENLNKEGEKKKMKSNRSIIVIAEDEEEEEEVEDKNEDEDNPAKTKEEKINEDDYKETNQEKKKNKTSKSKTNRVRRKNSTQKTQKIKKTLELQETL